MQGNDRSDVWPTLKLLRRPKDQVEEFVDAFIRSRLLSIDEFLARRSKYVEIGKLTIAAILCACEKPGATLPQTVRNDDWYTALWQSLVADTHHVNDLARNRVRFITFNYDRSLEYFLHDATMHAFDVQPKEAYEAWSVFDILHVYGQLGEFGFPITEHHRDFGGDSSLSAEVIKRAADGIRIIPESRDGDKVFARCRDYFYDWAERICFLGFGFDSLNTRRLDLPKMLSYMQNEQKPLPAIFASVHGLRQPEIEAARSKICLDGDWVASGDTCLEALRYFGLLVG